MGFGWNAAGPDRTVPMENRFLFFFMKDWDALGCGKISPIWLPNKPACRR